MINQFEEEADIADKVSKLSETLGLKKLTKEKMVSSYKI